MEFIYFGNDWSAENRTSSHHIAKHLSAQFPLLYVDVPGLRAPKANSRDLAKLFNKLRVMFRPPQRISSTLWRMTLPQIPFQRSRMVRAINQAVSRRLIRRAVRSLGFTDVIAWFHVPHPGFLAGTLRESLSVFYCVDDYSRLPDVDGPVVQAMDDHLTSCCDVVFTVNQPLADARRMLNENVHVSPHGVDTELFALATSAETVIPEGLRDLSRPIIGSWGLVDARVDLAIVQQIARGRPDWTILLVGRIATDVSALKRLPNVVLAGTVPYGELPNWAKAMDVCILPYVQTSLVLQSSPLKLREFLASGKPLVATPLPEVSLLGDTVEIAEDGPGFIAAIERALEKNTPELTALRQKAVEGSTWEAVVRRILDTLQVELDKRRG